MRLLLCLLATTSLVSAQIGDRLQAGYFPKAPMPLTMAEAEANQWTRVGGGTAGCNQLYGFRYRINGRISPTMLYSANGRVAGLQFAVDTKVYPPYPSSNVQSPPWFPDGDDMSVWSITLHFSDPATICNANAAPTTGLGDRVWARWSQANNDASSFEVFPTTTAEIFQANTAMAGWRMGGCLLSVPNAPFLGGMGQHYWKLSPQDSVPTSYPWFLLFDHENQLNQIGIQVSAVNLKYPTPTGKPTGGWWLAGKKQTNPSLYNAGIVTEPAAPSPTALNASFQVWAYPEQSLIPNFHLRGQMPENLLWLNAYDSAMPCGNVTTATVHLVIKDSMNLQPSACKFSFTDKDIALFGPATTPQQTRTAYGFDAPPYDVTQGRGVRNVAAQCIRDSEYAAMVEQGGPQGINAEEMSESSSSSSGDSKTGLMAAGFTVGALFLVAAVAFVLSKRRG